MREKEAVKTVINSLLGHSSREFNRRRLRADIKFWKRYQLEPSRDQRLLLEM